jgi:hypothetical protein
VPIETDQLHKVTASPGAHGNGLPELTSKSTKPVRTAAVAAAVVTAAAAAAAPAFEGGHQDVNMIGAPIIDKVRVCVNIYILNKDLL